MLGTRESFRRVGVQVNALGNVPVNLFAANRNLIADMEASMVSLDLKGASGFKPCIKCSNGVMKGALTDPNPTSRIPNPDNQLLEITATTLHGFVRNTNEALWESVDELQDMSRLVAEKQ